MSDLIYSVDIETTGDDPDIHTITEIGVVEIDPIQKSIGKTWHFHVQLSENTVWSRFCLKPHRIMRINEECQRYSLKEIYDQLSVFLKQAVAVGKNVAKFDLRFIEKQIGPGLFDHRTLDVGQSFWEPGMKKVPTLQQCMEIAAREGCEKFTQRIVEHTALQDAIDTAHLFLWKLKSTSVSY